MSYAYIAEIVLLVVCVVHAIRSGRIFPWIYVIVFLPVIGSLIYIAVEIVPGILRGRQAARIGVGMRELADPGRSLRQAGREAALVGSVDAKRALAEQHLARGHFEDAVAIFKDALQGQFSQDTALLYGLARAQFLAGDASGAERSLSELEAAEPGHMSDDARLLYAKALEAQGKDSEALAVYRPLVRVYPGQEARARYGLLLKKTGSPAEANEVFREILRLLDGAPRRYARTQRQWGEIARQNLG
ncbi:MAG: tetratricopeptide repeat protein [Alphaproteobacteria bacterium]|nr:tetratricopeptide repeat protein [Alphaproteobacteria bacterium]